MWKCEDCEQLIEDGEEKQGSSVIGEFWGSPAYQDYIECPHCGGEIYNIERCPICDEYVLKDNEKFCKDCIEDVKVEFKKLLSEKFNDEERELISEMGVYWI